MHANRIADRRWLGRNAVRQASGNILSRWRAKWAGNGRKGIGITFQTFTYSNCRLVIRIRYDSQIRIFQAHRDVIARAPCNPAAIDINQVAAVFLFHVSRPILKRFRPGAAERLMGWITRCRPNRLRSRPRSP